MVVCYCNAAPLFNSDLNVRSSGVSGSLSLFISPGCDCRLSTVVPQVPHVTPPAARLTVTEFESTERSVFAANKPNGTKLALCIQDNRILQGINCSLYSINHICCRIVSLHAIPRVPIRISTVLAWQSALIMHRGRSQDIQSRLSRTYEITDQHLAVWLTDGESIGFSPLANPFSFFRRCACAMTAFSQAAKNAPKETLRP